VTLLNFSSNFNHFDSTSSDIDSDKENNKSSCNLGVLKYFNLHTSKVTISFEIK
jgi:hypothetical protein